MVIVAERPPLPQTVANTLASTLISALVSRFLVLSAKVLILSVEVLGFLFVAQIWLCTALDNYSTQVGIGSKSMVFESKGQKYLLYSADLVNMISLCVKKCLTNMKLVFCVQCCWKHLLYLVCGFEKCKSATRFLVLRLCICQTGQECENSSSFAEVEVLGKFIRPTTCDYFVPSQSHCCREKQNSVRDLCQHLPFQSVVLNTRSVILVSDALSSIFVRFHFRLVWNRVYFGCKFIALGWSFVQWFLFCGWRFSSYVFTRLLTWLGVLQLFLRMKNPCKEQRSCCGYFLFFCSVFHGFLRASTLCVDSRLRSGIRPLFWDRCPFVGLLMIFPTM